MEPITLSTERLLLRPFGPQDTLPVHAACQDPDIQRWTVIPSPYRLTDAELFTTTLVPAGWRDDSAYGFALVLRETGTLVGALGIDRRSLPGTYEVGYWSAAEHRGRGYVTEAVLRAAHWAFTSLGADRLEWRAEIGNAASRAVVLRAGFRLEGDQRSGLLNKGVRRDAWTAALLPSDLGLAGSHPYVPEPRAPRPGTAPEPRR
ncbi:GNAT family N-acetyltransferase [Streptomyces griseus]|uniref:Acetyltransferase n=1 Tax=Streptomyces griseus subsp. griseus (strain JCM 4626 / CBS 651.72 / NBRC 13350 / KCC S-0626 / ISP 5235) TaxID=455632 RepID=B1VUY3_STRGG|nr:MULTISPECIES: GNAT family N-acetyltransferase [Streptomyces]MYR11405.1 GNAT family N-acetyltransferase [Streptomyces sp. SID724]MYR52184.1 GNAT family N-acetyltransferase [Streptomyces sp. SID4928]EGE44153.1 GCN5-related N-acetyltransferase [Streptomyces sp. ACT-1]SCE52261.1 Protein N-acetyltransferase, RimJ/RimL family [Streptomyces sp. OspMP-M43]SEE67528.1 Protein N-acetyltransferase, RimJ/RimL family [Streptomyces griseus]